MSLSHTSEFYENEKRLAAFALIHSITEIRVEFDGSGDSGQIESIDIESPHTDIGTRPIFVFTEPGYEFDDKKLEWKPISTSQNNIPLRDFIERHVNISLDHSNVDWYNNEGGYGTWKWTPKYGVTFEVYYRIETSELGYIENRPIGQPDSANEEISTEIVARLLDGAVVPWNESLRGIGLLPYTRAKT